MYQCSSVATGKKDLEMSMRPQEVFLLEYVGNLLPGFEFTVRGNQTSLRGTVSSALAEFSIILLWASVLEQILKSSNPKTRNWSSCDRVI